MVILDCGPTPRRLSIRHYITTAAAVGENIPIRGGGWRNRYFVEPLAAPPTSTAVG